MRVVWRALAVVLGLAGATGLVLCIAGIVGCWMAYAEAVRRVDRTFDRVEGSLGDVRDGLSQVADRLRGTQGELEAIRVREADLAAHPPAERSHRRAISRQAAEGAVLPVAEARQKLIKATEVALVLEGLLDVLAELPLGERVSVETGTLQEATNRLEKLIGRFEQLAATLAKTSPSPTDGVSDESSRIYVALDKVVETVDSVAERTDIAHERVRAWRAKIIRWLTGTAAGVTFLLAWIGLGQLSLLVHGYTGVRRRSGSNLPVRIT